MTMAAAAVAAMVRNGVLHHMRLKADMRLRSGWGSAWTKIRFMSEEAKGTFLDKDEVADRVISVIKNFQKVDPSKVTPTAHFQKDLGLDSLDTVEIVMALEEEFGFEIPDNEADKIDSCNLAIDYIAAHPQAK